MADLILKPGRERALLGRHPWVFSGAVKRIDDVLQPGDEVTVRASDGRFLARGYANPRSQIIARVLTFDDEPIDQRLLARRLDDALRLRAALPELEATNARRLLNAEGDGLPGLVVDAYGDVVVAQLLTAGMERRREDILRLLEERLSPRALIERSDTDARTREGLEPRAEVVRGELSDELLDIEEAGRRFAVDVLRGHKTGFYLDQRENRRRVAELAEGRDVLNAFSYTGGFGVYARAAGAKSVVHVDTSDAALALAKENHARSGVPLGDEAFVRADAFDALRRFAEEGRRFDLIVLDPPKLAHKKAHLDKALRAYKDLNLHGLKLLRPGGLLFTFSCSGLVDVDLFQKVAFGASLDAEVQARVVGRLGQAADHPFTLAFPEGEYLKGLVLSVSAR